MKNWKKKVWQEIMCELHIIRQLYKKIIEGQRQSFQIELERIRGKVEKLESRSKLLKNELKVLKSPREHTSQKTLLTKIILLSSSGTQNKSKKSQMSKLKSQERSQTQ